MGNSQSRKEKKEIKMIKSIFQLNESILFTKNDYDNIPYFMNILHDTYKKNNTKKRNKKNIILLKNIYEPDKNNTITTKDSSMTVDKFEFKLQFIVLLCRYVEDSELFIKLFLIMCHFVLYYLERLDYSKNEKKNISSVMIGRINKCREKMMPVVENVLHQFGDIKDELYKGTPYYNKENEMYPYSNGLFYLWEQTFKRYV